MWFFNSLQEDITFGSSMLSAIIVASILGYTQNKILMPFGIVLMAILPALFSGYQMSCFVHGDCQYLAWFYTALIFLSSVSYIIITSMAASKTEDTSPPAVPPASVPVVPPAV